MISEALAIIENEEQRNELAVFYEKQKIVKINSIHKYMLIFIPSAL